MTSQLLKRKKPSSTVMLGRDMLVARMVNRCELSRIDQPTDSDLFLEDLLKVLGTRLIFNWEPLTNTMKWVFPKIMVPPNHPF